jgi:hypothetical protein
MPGINFILRRFELNCALVVLCISDKPVEQRAQAEYGVAETDNGGMSAHLQNNTEVANGLIAFEQIHLLGCDLPAAATVHDTMTSPPR